VADATLDIAVRVTDVATASIKGIGDRIGRFLLAPFNAVGRSVSALFNRIFSLRGIITGGALVAGLREISALSKDATEFVPNFDEQTQKRIDGIALAERKLSATFKNVFGSAAADSPLQSWLEGLSDWLADNKQAILNFFRDVRDFFSDVVTFIRAIANASPEWLKKAPDFVRNFVASMSLEFHNLLQTQREVQSLANLKETISKLGGDTGGLNLATYPTNLSGAFATSAKDLRDAAEAAGVAASAQEDLAKSYDAANEVLTKYLHLQRESSANLVKEKHSLGDYVVSLREVADTLANQTTDALMGFIDGSLKAGQAFSQLVSGILKDLGRLLIQRSLLDVFGSLLGVTGFGSGTTGFAGIFGNPGGKASGGTVERSGVYNVGERGPERVFLGRGSRVQPNGGGQGGGGLTINVVGARDPKQTASEVVAMLRSDHRLRRALGV